MSSRTNGFVKVRPWIFTQEGANKSKRSCLSEVEAIKVLEIVLDKKGDNHLVGSTSFVMFKAGFGSLTVDST